MIRTILVCFVTWGLLMLAPACKKYQPAPAAFHWKPSAVTVAPESGQGTASHNITDYWLYVNGQFQGAYPVGATLPIVSHGKETDIRLLAGIKNNGIATTRIWWPFYKALELDTLLPAGSTLTVPAQFSYIDDVTFVWQEDFDGGIGVSLTKSIISDTTYRMADPADCFENRSIELGLAPGAYLAQIETSGQGLELPTNTPDVYLEVNYKCNHEFSVGLMGDDMIPRPILHVNPRNEWNKIYIQLAQAVNMPETSSRYKVYFRMVRSESQENLRLFLDNIKLVYL